MDFINLNDLLILSAGSGMLSSIGSALSVVLGLGAVIFFHELGHFAVAKWCDVHVERFSIGIGPIIWSRQKGETEYALSALPFGGYVKMLGQDDMDPSQMTADEIAENPRSYSSKKVWQRMAIISAGVIMNVITGFFFFATAYWMGVVEQIEMVGIVIPGGPAWVEGLEPGDTIEKVNGDDIQNFIGITQSVVLSRGSLELEGTRKDGTPFEMVVNPKMGDMTRHIGCGPASTSTLSPTADGTSNVMPGGPASEAEGTFLPGDRIVAMNGEPVEYLHDVSRLSAKFASEPIVYDIQRPPKKDVEAAEVRDSDEADIEYETVQVTVPPRKMRSIGLWMAIGKVSAIRKGSIAAQAGLSVDDQILTVDDQEVGKQIDPLVLPNYFAQQAGQEVRLKVARQRSGDSTETVELTLTPDDTPGWSDKPLTLTAPLPIPAIGAAFHVQPRIAHIVPGSAAEKSGKFKVGQRISKIELLHPDPKNITEDALGDTEKTEVKLPEPGSEDAVAGDPNWAYVFLQMQSVPKRNIRVYIAEQADGEDGFAHLFTTFEEADNFYTVIRGITAFRPYTRVRVADGIPDAASLAFRETKSSIISIYMTLRSLVGRDLSAKALSGPLGIVNIGYQIANDGFARLLKFLGYLSINLAVLNFLPIPVLDGGHMVFLIWEAVARRKPSPRVVNWAHGIGLIFIITLFVFVLYLDIFVNGLG
ncbi:MAG: site-2 protease family protein [Fuerstiella sp.]